MSKLPDVSGTELVKALQKAGFLILRQKRQSRLDGES